MLPFGSGFLGMGLVLLGFGVGPSLSGLKLALQVGVGPSFLELELAVGVGPSWIGPSLSWDWGWPFLLAVWLASFVW